MTLKTSLLTAGSLLARPTLGSKGNSSVSRAVTGAVRGLDHHSTLRHHHHAATSCLLSLDQQIGAIPSSPHQPPPALPPRPLFSARQQLPAQLRAGRRRRRKQQC